MANNQKTQKNKKNRLSLLALEPRLVFDGAAAVTAELNDPAPLAEADLTAQDTEHSTAATVDIPASVLSTRQELVVVDGALPDLQTLLDDIRAADLNRTVLVLDQSGNEVEELTTYLQQHTGQYDAIHVLSHGGEGWIMLGSETLQLAVPEKNTLLWNSVKTSLTQDGDLLLYGCHVGSGAAAQTSLGDLARMTASDIAASADITGIHGNWVLEFQAGKIEAETIQAADYQGDLWVIPASGSIPNSYYGTTYPAAGGQYIIDSAHGVLEGGWWGDTGTRSSLSARATYNNKAELVAGSMTTPLDLTLGANTGGAGVRFTMIETLDTSVQAVADVTSSSYATAVANNDYFYSTMVVSGSNGLALNDFRYGTVASKTLKTIQDTSLLAVNGGPFPDTLGALNNTGAKLALALYDPVTSTLTRLTGSDLAVDDSTTPVFASASSALTKVGLTPGATYELRFYVWRTDGGSGAATVYVDNPVIYAVYNQTPSATADAINAYGSSATTGNLITVNNGSGVDSDPESQTLTLQQINGAAFAVGSAISTSHGTLIITNINGAFSYTANPGYTGSDSFSYTIDDGCGGSSTATATITVNSPPTVNDITVNEGSPYAVFTVTATQGQTMTLALAAGTAAGGGVDYGSAAVPADNLQYSLDGGTTWTTYTGSFSATRTGSGIASGLLVRTKIINDTTPDNGETFTLTVTPTGGTAVTGTATIKDDGTGDIFTSEGAVDATAVRDGDYALSVNNLIVNEGTPYAVWTVKYVAGQSVNLDLVYDSTAVADDLKLGATPQLQYYDATSNSGVGGWVNYTGAAVTIPNGGKLLVRTTVENDVPYEVSEVLTLSVLRASGASVDIANTNVLDVNVVRSAGALDNTAASNLITNGRFTSFTGNATSRGGTWTAYFWGANSTLKGVDVLGWIESGGGSDTYACLVPSNTGSLNNLSTTGIYFGNAFASSTPAITFNSDGVNANTYTLLNTDTAKYGTDPVRISQTISTQAGVKYRLQFTQGYEPVGSTPGAAAVDIGGQRVFFEVNFSNRVYTLEFTAASSNTEIAFINWGHVGGVPELVLDNVIVNRVPGVTGTLTILDNGQGDLFSSANVTGTADAPGTATSGGTLTLNDDRGNNPVVNDVTVNEGSPYAVFTVDGLPGAKVDLTMSTAGGAGAADLSADVSGWEWSNDGGQTWSSNLSGAPLNATTGQMLVRFVPTNDATLETSEAFTLQAQYSATQTVAGVNSNTATNFDTAIGTIKDDGSGQWFTGSSATGSNSAPVGSALNDDRGLAVSSVSANEASPYMVFEVTGTVGQLVSLALDTTGTGASHADLATDLQNAGTGVPLQVYNGTAWVDYTPGTLVAIPAGNGGKMLVRTKLVNDTSYEVSETYLLTASNVDATLKNAATAGSVPVTASGTGTIVDDGTGNLFSASNTTGTAEAAGTNGLPSVLNNDQPITVNNISVNEGSPYGVFVVGDTAGRSITLALANGTATGTGTDYGAASSVTTVGQSNLEYSLDGGSTWLRYTGAFISTLSNGATAVLVRTPIVNDNAYDNGETFTLTATPAAGNAVVGTATIHDDGTGQWFNGTSGAGSNSAPAGQHLDGDMPLTVDHLIVNEGTPYAVWTVTYGAGKQVSLALSDGTVSEAAQMGRVGPATVATDLLTYAAGHQMETSVNGGATWTPYSAGSSVAMGEDSKLLVRVRVNNDVPYEVSEVLNLTVAKYSSGTVNNIAGSAVRVVSNAQSLAGTNLIANGDFDTYTQNSSLIGRLGAWQYVDIASWQESGGDYSTYATVQPGSVDANEFYFGNSYAWVINGAPWNPAAVFNAQGVSATAQLNFARPAGTGFGNNDTPVTISQTISTQAGGLYRLQFKQDYEPGFGGSGGIAALEIDGQRVYFRIDKSVNTYTFEFTANTGTSTTLSFMSWGHVNFAGVSNLGIVTSDSYTTELKLDEVTVNQIEAATGTLTILDNGQGSYYDGTSATPLASPPPLNDDRAANPVVNDVTVNEGSPYGVFMVNGMPGASVDLSATAGTASLSADLSGMAWSNDGGATWSTNLSGATLDANGALLVRFVPTNDTTYEASESFTLTATYSATQPAGVVVTTGASDVGTGTVQDDGTGQWFASSTSGTGSDSAPAGAVLNDDRVIGVNSIGVNESSGYAVFTVTGSAGQTVNNLALAAGTATGGGVDYGSASVPADNLQYSLDGGLTWQTWTAGGSFAIPAKDAAGATVAAGSPNGSFLVRTKIINDTPFDNGETFTLTATLGSGQTSTGTCTIFDDGTGTVFTSTGGIDTTTAKNDDRGANPVVNDVTVNEGSPFAVFAVEGKPGAQMQLDLVLATGAGQAASADLSATTPALEYFDGTQWVAYNPASKPVIPSNTGGKLFVRTAVVNDALNEGAETFTLKATYVSGTINTALGVTANASDTGIGTIVDNGSGTKFVADDPATPGVDESAPALGTLNGNSVWVAPTVTPVSGSQVLAADAPTLGNDDRPVTVTGFTVNEASPYGIFKVTGAAGQYVTLTLADGTAAGGNTSPADGSVDYSNTLEYFDGSAWQTYVPGAYVQIPSGGTTLLVRTAIVNDTSYEAQQSFTLTVANTQGTGAGNSATATGNIIDNGTGSLFAAGNTTGTPDAAGTNGAPATLNDDRVANPAVNSVTVNEGSPYIVFSIAGMPQAGVTIALANDSATGVGHAVLGTDTADTSTLQVYRNGAWVAYSAANSVINTDGTLLVRLAVTNDNPIVYEGPETFGITATYNGLGTPASAVTVGGSASGVGTIVDNGTGSVFIAGNTTGTPDTSGTGYPAALDNDKPTFAVSDPTIAENGDLVYTVTMTGASILDATVSYASADGTAVGADYTAVSGTLTFASNSGVQTQTQTVTVHTAQDAVYEGNETVNLNLSAAANATIADAQGVGTITDVADLPTASITNVEVNEHDDPYPEVVVSFDRASSSAITFSPTLTNTSAVTGRLRNTPSGAPVEYYNGSAWVSAASGVTVAAGQTSVRLRSSVLHDSTGQQTTAYSVDTGALSVATASVTSLQAVVGTVTVYDQPTMSISNVTVNEASPYAVVQLSLSTPASSPITFTPTLANGSGTAGTDATGVEYFDGTNWVSAAGGVTIAQGASGVLLRTAITHDTMNEVSETVQIVTGAATNVLNPSGVTGTITILDQGSTAVADVKMFSASATSTTPDITPASGAVVNPGTLPASQMLLDDDRPLSVDSVTVNENSPWIVFKVTGAVDQYVKLTTVDGTAVAGTASPTDGSVDYRPNLQYFDGSAWVNYTPNTFVKLPGGGTTLMVRTALVQDVPYEGAQTFNLVATNTGGTSTPLTQGVGTIVDDGSGTVFKADDPATPADESVPVNNAAPTVTPPTSAVVDPATSPVPLRNDDRPLSVDSVTVNENSPWIVFKVTGAVDQYVKLTTVDGTAVAGTASPTDGSVDYRPNLQYFDGSAWVNYTPNTFVKLPGGGTTLMVRTALVQDVPYEGAQTFNLVATNTGGTSTPLTQGVGTIVDDGSGTVFKADDPATPADESVPVNNAAPTVTPPTSAVVDPATSPVPLPNDDRPLKVNSVEVNESSPWLVWTVTGKQGQYVKLGVASDTGTLGIDTGAGLQWWNGSQWLDYVPGSFVKVPGSNPSVNGDLLVRVSVTKDYIFEGPEKLTLTATNVGGTSTPAGQGVGIIRDDGQGSLFVDANHTGLPDPLGTPGAPAYLDDDRFVPEASLASVLPGSSRSETVGRGWTSSWMNPLTYPSLHVQDTVQGVGTGLVGMQLQGMAGDVMAGAAGCNALGVSILWKTDELIESFDRPTDPDLHVQHAVAGARSQANALLTMAYMQQTGLLREPIGQPEAQSVRRHQAQQAVASTLADQTLAQMHQEVFVQPQPVAQAEAPKRGALSFSEQLKQTASRHRPAHA